jgi:hypothetical protein
MYFGGGLMVTAASALAIARNPAIMNLMMKNSLLVSKNHCRFVLNLLVVLMKNSWLVSGYIIVEFSLLIWGKIKILRYSCLSSKHMSNGSAICCVIYLPLMSCRKHHYTEL